MRKFCGIAFLVLFLSIFFSVSYAAADSTQVVGIHWQKWSLSLFERARREHKLVLIFGKVRWCHWCQSIENSTFPNPAVAQLINQHYIPVKVDIENEVALGSRYKITEIPAFIVLDSHNQELKRFYGYQSAQSLIRKLSR